MVNVVIDHVDARYKHDKNRNFGNQSISMIKTGTLVTKVGLQVKSLFLPDLTKTECVEKF